MAIQRDTMERLLTELAQWLEFENVKQVEWVVCGGAAMSLQGLVQRTTRDIDVLGEWDQTLLEIACIEGFSDPVKSSIGRVVTNHPELAGFGNDWVNLGPSNLTRRGLPKGFSTRMKSVKFGSTLVLHLLGREDLIALKLYAASDRHSSRQAVHFHDLELLNASFDELDVALDWVRTQPDYDEKSPEIQVTFQRLGHDDLNNYV